MLDCNFKFKSDKAQNAISLEIRKGPNQRRYRDHVEAQAGRVNQIKPRIAKETRSGPEG